MANAPSELRAAKDRARSAYIAAIKAEPGLANLCQKWWATALAAADSQPAVAHELFRRTAILLEILIDMRGWPSGRIR